MDGFDVKPPHKQREVKIVSEMEPYKEDDKARDYQKSPRGDRSPFITSEGVAKGDVDPLIDESNPEDEWAEKIDAGEIEETEELSELVSTKEEVAEYEKLQKRGFKTGVWRAEDSKDNKEKVA